MKYGTEWLTCHKRQDEEHISTRKRSLSQERVRYDKYDLNYILQILPEKNCGKRNAAWRQTASCLVAVCSRHQLSQSYGLAITAVAARRHNVAHTAAPFRSSNRCLHQQRRWSSAIGLFIPKQTKPITEMLFLSKSKAHCWVLTVRAVSTIRSSHTRSKSYEVIVTVKYTVFQKSDAKIHK